MYAFNPASNFESKLARNSESTENFIANWAISAILSAPLRCRDEALSVGSAIYLPGQVARVGFEGDESDAT